MDHSHFYSLNSTLKKRSLSDAFRQVSVVMETYAISRFPPVFDRQPRVVGLACLS